MYRIHLSEDGSAKAGDEVYIRGADDIQAVGKIVDAQSHPDGGSEALAVLQIDKVRQSDLSLSTADGAHITLRSLPYALNSA